MMQLSTLSKFYYGYVIDTTNNILDFQESGGALTATLNGGSYTFTDFLTEIARALNAAGGLVYTVSGSRTTRLITISTASTNFKLLTSTGTHLGTSPFTLMGFSGSDKTGAHTYTGGSASGTSYQPQFKLQSYVSPNDWRDSIQPTINESASGIIEVVKYGVRQFSQFEIMYATDRPQTSKGPITSSNTGIEDLEAFMTYLITKGPLEFMPDQASPLTYIKCICETTELSSTGTGFKLLEMYDKGLPGYFRTGLIKMRVVT